MRAVLGFVLASSCLASADGAVIDVKVNGALPTIQQGIAAAAPGDTVRVFAGVYPGTVIIPNGLNGLKLIGVGNVVIDARADDGSPIGRGLWVQADSCLVRKLTIRHAATASQLALGYGVLASGDGIVLDRVIAMRCDTAGFRSSGVGLTAKSCSAIACTVGFDVTGAQSVLEKCRAERCETRGFDVQANSVVLRKNIVRTTDTGDGIYLDGDDGTIEGNDVRRVGGNGISLRGTNHLVRKNNCFGPIEKAGILWEGEDATIEQNTVLEAVGVGIDVLLIGTATVTGNRVERCGRWGIRAGEEDFALVDVRKNIVRDVASHGIYTSTDFGAVEHNDVRNCGTKSTDAGIKVTLGGMITDNYVRGGAGDGFQITADDVVLANNRAFDNAVDGFDVESSADGVVLDGNTALRNLGEGIEINGSNAIVKNNVCSKNRIDLATSALLQTFTANTFATGGPLIAPQIE